MKSKLCPSRGLSAPAKSLTIALTAGLFLAFPLPQSAAAQEQDETLLPEGGIPVTSDLVARSCRRCHRQADDGRMTRISYSRKTPEGWELTVRRMVTLNDVDLDPDVARQIVRYLSDQHGLAPEELRPARWEVERRMVDYEFPNEETAATCNACHTVARAMIQRRTKEEWTLLMDTHRGLYPLVDFQAFLNNNDEPPHPVDKAVDDLSERYPLVTPEWSAWSATMRAPRLAGTWALSGNEVGMGPFYGTVTITEAGDGEFTTETVYRFAKDQSAEVRRSGSSNVYTGYQWRGRNSGRGDDFREVMMVERDWNRMSGRWFSGAYDELGKDVTLTRLGSAAVVQGAYPRALQAGSSGTEVTLFGAGLPTGLSAADVDLGPGVRVAAVESAGPTTARLRVDVAEDATVGQRDVFLAGVHLPDAITVFDQVHRITVTPEWGMARVGGANFPKQYQHFGAIAWHDGADEEPDTEDDVELGAVDASWSMEEYAATFGDEDINYVGELRPDGLFIPNIDGPNPERKGMANNIGDVWVVASYTPPGSQKTLRARAHLLVTVPLYMRWDPWAPSTRPATEQDGRGGAR